MRWPCNINKSRMVLLVALLFTALGAGAFRTPSILFMTAVLCGAPVLGSLVGRFSARDLRLKRQFPSVGMVGDVVVARLTLSNQGSWPAFLVHCRLVQDKVSEARKTENEPGNEVGDAALELRSEGEHIEPILASGARISWEEHWQLRRRGTHWLTRAGAGALDPLGLYGRLGVLTPPQEILVLPRPLKIGRLGFDGGTAGGIRPPQQAARVAEAADFHGIRPHYPGEGLRRIHWKSTARTGELHVIEWQEEMACDLTLFLDVQASVHGGKGSDNSLETLVILAATIANYLLENGHRFGMMWWQETQPASREAASSDAALESLHLCRYEARNMGGVEAMLRALAGLQPCSHAGATLAHLVSQGAVWVPPRQGVLLLSSERADVGAASARFAAQAPQGQARAQVLLVEAASFETQNEGEQGATATSETHSNSVPSDEKSAAKMSPRAGQFKHRSIARGDSMVAVLERGV